MSDGKPGRKELARAVEELTAEVAALRENRAAHRCGGCLCQHVHWHSWPYVIPGCAPAQTAVWYGTITTGGSVSDVTSVAAGGISSLALGN
jgi:hypothetical protein